MHATAPHTYPRRILVAVTGLSPQVVTETLYALAVAADLPFVPTDIKRRLAQHFKIEGKAEKAMKERLAAVRGG